MTETIIVTASDSSGMADDIPSLSPPQRESIHEFIQRHRDETEGRISVNPILLARVVARDKPAADIDLKGDQTHPAFDDPDQYLHSLCATLGLSARKIRGVRSWTVGHSSWRLDLLPTTHAQTTAYHRRCGFVYGYPPDAIEDFIETTTKITTCDLVRAGIFDAEEIAYLTFVSYTYHNSIEKYDRLIDKGRAICKRIGQLATAWELPLLDEYATLLHHDTTQAFLGQGTYSVPTSFPPEQDITQRDIQALLS